MRVQQAATSAMFTQTTDITLGPWFYDRDGVQVDTATIGFNPVAYRVDGVIHGSWNATPPNVDISVLRPANIVVAWPVDPISHAAIGSSRKAYTFYLRRP